MNVIQTAIPPSLNNANDTDVDVTNFDEVLELTLTWLLEAQDGLSQQQPVSDNVATVKEQFQQHEVSCRETSDVSHHLLPSVELKRCVHKLSKSQNVDLRKSPLKLWTCKRLKFN